ncbi:MAG: triose-phosphate isomerase [Candidatus Dormibacterales bacterium]
MAGRRPLVAGNWKMNPLDAASAVALAQATARAASSHAGVEVAVFPPFPWLREVARALEGTPVALGAQDCHWEESGAFTGEVSPAMLRGWCRWVIVGHSERRALGETDEIVSRKVAAALAAGLDVVVCVGEREAETREGRAAEVVAEQVRRALSGCGSLDPARLAVAYEPVWAIGTGKNAEPAQAGAAVAAVRGRIAEDLGEAVSAGVRVLYGGSVTSANVAAYVEVPGCGGCLVGGASLSAEEFGKMIAAVAAEGS